MLADLWDRSACRKYLHPPGPIGMTIGNALFFNAKNVWHAECLKMRAVVLIWDTVKNDDDHHASEGELHAYPSQ